MNKTRLILFLFIILTVTISIFSFVFLGSDFFIRKWYLPISPPGFFDSRQFAWASESHAQGFDPLVENPVNPRGLQLNYPRIWHLLFSLGINESHTNILGSIVVILFFLGAGTFWYSKKFDNLTYIILCISFLSPAVMLGVERSNIELILFFLISLALTINYYSSISALFVFIFASILKLYPIFGIVYLLKETKRRFWTLFLAASGIFILYALFSLNDFMQVYKTTTKVVGSSFGMNVWWMGISHGRFLNLPIPDSTEYYLKLLSYIVVFLLVAISLYCGIRNRDLRLCDQSRYIDAFRVGAAIYIGCFILMNTIDYRMVFLVFTVPQIIEWIRNKEQNILLASRITLAAMLFSLWSTFVMRFLGRKITFVMEEFSNWIILAGMLYLLFSSLPDWLINNLRQLFSLINPFNRLLPSSRNQTKP